MAEIGIGLGSNIGDKAANIHRALALLTADGRVKLKKMSSLYRTLPWGYAEQDFFANACALVETALSPMQLLDFAKQIETDMGREKTVHWGPRLIDIDLLFYGNEAMANPRLILPHKELFNRAFVLVPLAEIAPDLQIEGVSMAQAAAKIGKEGIEIWRETP
ncbi:MAG: 2-amino-4-hydroxy-6-hydroxymethyldihydropteridine diphosphokinase [Hyphomicrobiales bacterium]|nr:2-amino-4-hydroxy-6-hydroxymethyldihydropteridine diphosphokinase [Hyphomicrobiales bacterium]MDE2115316.1 2-amino-4-hydroxy-6-hydroxymethyldihydropteridine diphosphokinase [Hyphomicrobiales bacterium]